MYDARHELELAIWNVFKVLLLFFVPKQKYFSEVQKTSFEGESQKRSQNSLTHATQLI